MFTGSYLAKLSCVLHLAHLKQVLCRILPATFSLSRIKTGLLHRRHGSDMRPMVGTFLPLPLSVDDRSEWTLEDLEIDPIILTRAWTFFS